MKINSAELLLYAKKHLDTAADALLLASTVANSVNMSDYILKRYQELCDIKLHVAIYADSLGDKPDETA